LRVNKKIVKALFAALVISLLFAAAAFADVLSLWNGDIKKGDITSRKNEHGGTDVAIEEVISALGLARSSVQQGIVVVYDGKKMEFWNNSCVVRVNGSIISLPNPVSVEGEHWWADSKAMLTVLGTFYKAIGKDGAIRWAAADEAPPAAVKDDAKSDLSAPKKQPQDINGKTQTQTAGSSVDIAESSDTSHDDVQPLTLAVVFKGKNRPVAVLDAGHGGHDPGAMANGIREKDINLKAVTQLGSILRSYGVDVRYTRDTDVYLKLGERTAFANKHNASVFVSMHCNAMPKGKRAAGLEFYIMALPSDKDAMQLAIAENKEISGGAESVTEAEQRSDKKTRLLLKILGDMQQNDKINESTVLVEYMHTAAKSFGLPMRKVGQAPFFVLRGAAMPAVLIEMGYLTDAAEAQRLNSQSYRESLCRSIADGIVSYIKDHPVVLR